LVVAGVGDQYHIGVARGSVVGEAAIADNARGLAQIGVVGRFVRDVGLFTVAWDVPCRAAGVHKRRIGGGLSAAQAVVEVKNRQGRCVPRLT
jgi:hypothetical protein